MELDTLIAQITQEVCLRIQTDAQRDTGQDDIAKYMEYTLIDPGVKLDEIQRMCAVAKQKKIGCVSIPQWFVAFAREQLAGSGVKVSTSVGLPGGATSTAAKYAEVKEAVKNGADEVDIPINMGMLLAGDLEGVKKDLEEAMVPAKDKALVKAVIEVGGITLEQQISAVEVCKQCHADYITVSTILCGSSHTAGEVEKVVRMCKHDTKVKVIGKVKSRSIADALIAAGVDRIGTSAAQAIA